MAKAAVRIKCQNCGKEFWHEKTCYNRAEADKYETWAQENITMCPECYAAKQRIKEEEAKKALMKEIEEWEINNGLPALIGTPRQVEWAREIRYNSRSMYHPGEHADHPRAEKRRRVVEYVMSKCTNAADWIDGRSVNHEGKLAASMDMLNEWAGKFEETQHGVDYTSEEFARYPEGCSKPGTVEISASEDIITAKYVKDDDFRRILKNKGYRWDPKKAEWYRKINKFSGPARDRAAELGNFLLRAGFGIRCKFSREIHDIISVLNNKYGDGSAVEFAGELSQSRRNKNIDIFRTTAHFLVANKTCAGYGLNLQFCRNIIFYSNDFNWGTRSQAEDRVHRIGQTKDVHIWDIICDGTLDDKIISCLSHKENMLDKFKSEIKEIKDNKEVARKWILGGMKK